MAEAVGPGTRVIQIGVNVLFWLVFIVPLFWYGIPVVQLLMTGDFPGSANFFGLQEDDAFVSFLLDLRRGL